MPELSPQQRGACESVLLLSDWALPHVRQVERICGWMFAELRQFHGLGADEEALLRAAGLLHDVGFPTDPGEHHKASARIIRTHLGAPFTPAEVETIALLARYHRKAPPKLSHQRYAALDQEGRRLVGWLGGMLRVSDGLDRGHDAAVRGVDVVRIDGLLEIRVSGSSLDEDRHGGLRKRDLLERLLGMPVAIKAREGVGLAG